jgi:hypothetical protein
MDARMGSVHVRLRPPRILENKLSPTLIAENATLSRANVRDDVTYIAL